MRNTARLLAVLLSLIAGPALAQNVPANSVMGRLAIPTGGGPAQSIPLPNLAAALAPNFTGTAIQAASFEAMTTGGFKLGGSTFANQISTLGVAVNWLYAPNGSNAFYFDNTASIVFGDTIYNKTKNATVLSSLTSTLYQLNSNQMAIGASPLGGMLNIKGSNGDSTVLYGEGQGTAGALSVLPVGIVLRDLSTSHSSLINTQAVNSAGTVVDRAFALNGGFIIWDSTHEQTDLDIVGYRNGAVETMLQVYSGCLSAFNNNGNGPICPVDQSPRIAPGNTNSIYDVGAPATRFKSIYGTNVDVATNLVLNGATSGTITMKAAAIAGSNTITWPAGTTDFSATGGALRMVKQLSAGGAFTVAALTGAELPSPFTSGTASGNTTKFATTSGTLTSTHLAKFDANGNIIDGGAPTAVTFTIILQTFCNSGCTTTIAGGSTGTYTPTANTVYSRLGCYGGAGGGGGAANSASGISGGGGGGAGGFSEVVSSAATIGVSQTVTIGQRGTGGTAGANNGVAGGDSSIGALVVGKGGSAGNGATANNASTGGAGGVAGTGTIKGTGAPGSGGYGASVVTAAFASGNGGSSAVGGGGQAVLGTGGNATGFAAGGGGGASYAGAGNFAGGDATTGYCYAMDFTVN